MLVGGSAVLALAFLSGRPRHRVSGPLSQCASDFLHSRWYDPASDLTFCTRCQMLWEDSDMSGRPDRTYTVEHGWVIDDKRPYE
jgi:hypothetical protein